MTAGGNPGASLRIIVSGLAAQYPLGGVAWDYLQYVVGLARLGHDVYYHEDTWTWPYQPIRRTYTDDGSYSADFLGGFFDRHAPELADRWHYNHLHTQHFGMSDSAFTDVAKTADLFLNISGANMIPEFLGPQCVKGFVDTDPGYNQIVYLERFAWSENVDRWCDLVDSHDVFFTYGENINNEGCLIPEAGFAWKPTRMPVVLDQWRFSAALPMNAPWTTVMTWSAFNGPVVYDGDEYHSKGFEFEKLIDLPGRLESSFRVALGGLSAPTARLAAHGWEVVDAPASTVTPESYLDFIASSKGEISVAKQVYVAMRTGWFSTRSACYLAAGRPVIVQETGFSNLLPVGDGLLAFNDLTEAAIAVDAVESGYSRHSDAALAVAREYFDSKQVLTDLVERAMQSKPSALPAS